MRLLVLSLFFPLPADNGTKMRTWALLRALAAEGHEITLLTFTRVCDINGHSDAVRKICRHVEWVPHALKSASSGRDYLARFTQLFLRLPYGVRGARSGMMKQRITALLQGQKIDAIICEQSDPVVNVPAGLSVPLIVDHHDVQHLIWERYLEFEGNPVKRLYAWLERRKVRAWEQRACQRAAVSMACSEQDRSLFKALDPSLPVVVVPNTVETDGDRPNGEEDCLRILFQGAMDWYPNRDAVEFFVSAVLPKLRSLVPGVGFVAAGRNVPASFRQRFVAFPDVEFTGTVPDMSTEIARAAVCVVPLRIGSGTRLKILESAAMGKPVVSTGIGAEGLDFKHPDEILIADDPEAFANAVGGLLADPPLRRRIGQAARTCVEQNYSFSVLRSSVSRVVQELAAIHKVVCPR